MVQQSTTRDASQIQTRRVASIPRRFRTIRSVRRHDGITAARWSTPTTRGDKTIPDLADGVQVPTVPEDVHRRAFGGRHQWIVEPEIIRTYVGDTTVGMPLVILARSRSKVTLQQTLRLLAWAAAITRPSGCAGVGDPKSKPADALRHVIMPAVAEIQQLSDLVVEIQNWYAPSIRAPRGRVMGFDILVGDVDTKVVPAPAPTAEIVPMIGFKGWTPPGNDNDD